MFFKSQQSIWEHLLKGGSVINGSFCYEFQNDCLVKSFVGKNIWHSCTENFKNHTNFKIERDASQTLIAGDGLRANGTVINLPSPAPACDAAIKSYIVSQDNDSDIFFANEIKNVGNKQLICISNIYTLSNNFKMVSESPFSVIANNDGVVSLDDRYSTPFLLINGNNVQHSEVEVCKGDLIQIIVFSNSSVNNLVKLKFEPDFNVYDTDDDEELMDEY